MDTILRNENRNFFLANHVSEVLAVHRGITTWTFHGVVVKKLRKEELTTD